MRLNLLGGILMLFFTNGAAWAAQEAQEAPSLQCGVTEFPHEAAVYGLEGSTRAEYSLTAEGRLVDISIKRSSGWRALDEATIVTLAGCRMTRAPSPEKVGKRQAIDYDWTLDGVPSRQGLVPGSCRASDRVAGFRPLDKTASGADGILVRAKVRPSGEPQFVIAERGEAPADVVALAVEYLRSCRFALPPGELSPKDDAIYGRVLLK